MKRLIFLLGLAYECAVGASGVPGVELGSPGAKDRTAYAGASATELLNPTRAGASTPLAASAAEATAAAPAASPAPPERALVDWLLGLGSQVRVEVRNSGAGVRGLVAAGDVAAGEVLVSVPLSAALALGTVDDTAPELAVQLLRERYRARPRYGPYFDVLPPPPPSLPPPPQGRPGKGDIADNVGGGAAAAAAAGTAAAAEAAAAAVTAAAQAAVAAGIGEGGPPGGWQPSCVEEFPEEAVAALAGEDLRSLARSKREWMRRVWSGEEPSVRLPLSRAVPRRHVGLQEFAWATCMVTSRSIQGPGRSLLLIPLIDLANHCSCDSLVNTTRRTVDVVDVEMGAGQPFSVATGAPAPAAMPSQLRFRVASEEAGDAGGGSTSSSTGGGGKVVLELVAGRDLAAGEEVCMSYGDDLRPDEALLYYGFLPPAPPPSGDLAAPSTPARPLPLLAVDEREYDSTARPGKVPYRALEVGSAATAEVRTELARLKGRLATVTAELAAEVAVDAVSVAQDCTVTAQSLAGQCPDVLGRTAGAGVAAATSGVGHIPPCAAAAVGGMGTSTGDGGGGALSLVARLNQMRLVALRGEVARLQALLVHGPRSAWGQAT